MYLQRILASNQLSQNIIHGRIFSSLITIWELKTIQSQTGKFKQTFCSISLKWERGKNGKVLESIWIFNIFLKWLYHFFRFLHYALLTAFEKYNRRKTSIGNLNIYRLCEVGSLCIIILDTNYVDILLILKTI